MGLRAAPSLRPLRRPLRSHAEPHPTTGAPRSAPPGTAVGCQDRGAAAGRGGDQFKATRLYRTHTHIHLQAEIQNILSGGLSCPLRATLSCYTEQTPILALVSKTAPLLMEEQKRRQADVPYLSLDGPLSPSSLTATLQGPARARGLAPPPTWTHPARALSHQPTCVRSSRQLSITPGTPCPTKPSHSPGRFWSHADIV